MLIEFMTPAVPLWYMYMYTDIKELLHVDGIGFIAQGNLCSNMSVQCTPPSYPTFYGKMGVCRAINRRGGSNVYPQSVFWSKNKKNMQKLLLKIFNYFNIKNSLYIAWVCFHNVKY